MIPGIASAAWTALLGLHGAAFADPFVPPPPPSADHPVDPAADAAAQVLFDNGRRLYAEGRFAQAVVAFTEAYRLCGRPEMLFNLANAYERAGDLAEAIDALTRYRVFATPEEQEPLAQRTADLERRSAAAEAEAQAKAAAAAAEAEAERAALAASVAVPVAHPVRRSPAPWVLTAVGAALGAGGGAVASITWQSSRDLLDARDPDGWARLRPINNAGVGAAIAGAAVAIGGIGWGVAR